MMNLRGDKLTLKTLCMLTWNIELVIHDDVLTFVHAAILEQFLKNDSKCQPIISIWLVCLKISYATYDMFDDNCPKTTQGIGATLRFPTNLIILEHATFLRRFPPGIEISRKILRL